MQHSETPLLPPLAEHYAFGPELGRGGMAVVYLADDLRHHRKVAVKVLHPHITAGVGVDRFLREIEIAAGLTHPNILPIHDSGEARGTLYYVMPYVEGPSLRGLLDADGKLSIAEAVRIGCEVADALEYAHRRGVVHRDIKPENILMVEGHPVLSDFGIARAIHAATGERLTGDHLAVGTPGYMSPEQAVGDRSVDRRSDIYSLACVLHESLVGEVPQLGTGPFARRPSLGRRLQALRVPTHVSRALARALEPDPGHRFATAADFAGALRGSRPRLRLLALGTTAAAALALLLVARSWIRGGEGVGAAPVNLVVVGQLVNRTGDSSLAYLGIMAADWLTEGLLSTGVMEAVPTVTALEVSRAADAQLGEGGDPIRLIGDATGATLVVSGSYYRVGPDLQFQVQVTDARRRRLLGAIEVAAGADQRPTQAIEQVRARLMGLLATTFDPRLTESVGRGDRPPTFEAYRAFSEGMDRYVRNEWSEAARLFTAAFDLDSAFAAPLILASISWSNLDQNARADSILGVLAASRAPLPPHHRRWYDYRRALLDGDRPAALRAIRRIAAAAPGTKATYNLAVEALQNGRLDEALAALRSLSPDAGPMRDWIPYWDALGTVQHLLGRYSDESETGRRARAAYPDRLYAFGSSVRALAAVRAIPQVHRILAEAEALPPDPFGTSAGALALEAGLELLAHGDSAAAGGALERSVRWYAGQDLPRRLPRSDGLNYATALYAVGRWDEARSVAAALVSRDSTHAEALGLVGGVAARRGDTAAATRALSALATLPRRYAFGVPTVAEARITVLLGRRDAAINLLRRAFEEGKEYDLWLHRDLDFAALRPMPAFQELIRPRR